MQLLWFGKFFLVAKVAHVELELEAWTRVFCLSFLYFCSLAEVALLLRARSSTLGEEMSVPIIYVCVG